MAELSRRGAAARWSGAGRDGPACFPGSAGCCPAANAGALFAVDSTCVLPGVFTKGVSYCAVSLAVPVDCHRLLLAHPERLGSSMLSC